MPASRSGIAWALGLWALWTAATWWFEGRIGTFARPDAVRDRLVYTGIANILIGVLGSAVLLRHLARCDPRVPARAGFADWRRTVVCAPLGFAIGLALYFGQGAPSTDPVVLLNAYAQVFVVSLAEVLVCWSVVGATTALAIGAPDWIALPLAAVVASLLFGVYHFAHSPPFHTVPMVAFLAAVGLVTSAVFFVLRDIYGTILFHNFLAVFGVVRALAAQDTLAAFRSLQVPLLATALLALAILILCDRLVVRRAVAGVAPRTAAGR